MDTILPGSNELRHPLSMLRAAAQELRNEYILKPIRGGKGAGIYSATNSVRTNGNPHLGRLQASELALIQSYVIQRRIYPRLYDLVSEDSGARLRYPLVGTYHAVNGRLYGLGIWRSGGGRICAVSSGGALDWFSGARGGQDGKGLEAESKL